MNLYAGLDIGTGGVRINIVNSKLELLYEKSIKYDTFSPELGWAEQDPDQILKAVENILEETAKKYIHENLFVTFCSVMHSIMGVDKKGNCLTPLIIWADTRGKSYLGEIIENHGSKLFYQKTSCPLHSSYWPSKIMWLKDNMNETIDKFVSIKEYIIYNLSGEWKSDYALASTSGIFNTKKRKYDKKILDILKLEEKNLSNLYSSHHMFDFKVNGKVMKGILGSIDGALANLGVGSINENRIVITAGSSSAVRYTSRKPVKDPEGKIWNYLIDDDFYIIGEATNSAGLILNWFKDIFGYKNIQNFEIDNFCEVPYKENDLTYIPTMMGERGPNYNEEIKSFLYGLSLNHCRKDMIIAIYESIAFYLRMIYEDVKRLNSMSEIEIILTGGLGLRKKFMKLLYYQFGEIKYIPDYTQNTAIGAAMLSIKTVKGTPYEKQMNNFPDYVSANYKDNKTFSLYLEEKYKHFYEVYHHLQNNFSSFNFKKKY